MMKKLFTNETIKNIEGAKKFQKIPNTSCYMRIADGYLDIVNQTKFFIAERDEKSSEGFLTKEDIFIRINMNIEQKETLDILKSLKSVNENMYSIRQNVENKDDLMNIFYDTYKVKGYANVTSKFSKEGTKRYSDITMVFSRACSSLVIYGTTVLRDENNNIEHRALAAIPFTNYSTSATVSHLAEQYETIERLTK